MYGVIELLKFTNLSLHIRTSVCSLPVSLGQTGDGLTIRLPTRKYNRHNNECESILIKVPGRARTRTCGVPNFTGPVLTFTVFNFQFDIKH